MKQGKIYGYCRVSSHGQNKAAQLQLLKEYGCDEIFEEEKTGRKKEVRDVFNQMLDLAEEGDTVVVTKLDRFARSTLDALQTEQYLRKKDVVLVILNWAGQVVDTSTPIGKLMFTFLSGIAEFDADMIRERQLEGIAEAKKRGVYQGRPKRYTAKNEGLQHALDLYRNRDKNKMTVKQIERITKISRSTIYRAIKEQE